MSVSSFRLITRVLCPTLVAMLLSVSANAQSPGKVFGDAEEFYERGRYEFAVKKTVEVLRMKDTHRKAQELLQRSWNAFLAQSMNAIRTAEASASDFEGSARVRRLQEVVNAYKTLLDVRADCISVSHVVSKETGRPIDFGSNDYYEEWQSAKDKLKEGEGAAAEYHYARGLDFEKEATMERCKLAASEFKQANLNTPGYKDSRERYEINRGKATKRLAIIPFENSSGQRQFGAVENMITDWVVAALMKDGDAMEFTSIITRDELDRILAEQKLSMSALLDESSVVESGALLGVHQLVTGRINQLACEPAPDIVRQYQRQAQCFSGTRPVVGKDGKTRQEPVYVNASATITERKREVKSRINGSFKILDVRSGELIKSDSFTKEVPWLHSWGTFTGNECATGDPNDKILLGRREENPPSCNELTSQAGQQLATYLAGQIANAVR